MNTCKVKNLCFYGIAHFTLRNHENATQNIFKEIDEIAMQHKFVN